MNNPVIAINHHIKDLAAIEPCYGKYGGNATRIYTTGGQVELVTYRLLTVLKQIIRHFGYDLTTLRRNYCAYFACGQSVPLPLCHSLVLVPIKMRLPHTGDDGATGYINLQAVDKIAEPAQVEENGSEKCRIYLKGGQAVPSYISHKTIKQRLARGKQALVYHNLNHSGGLYTPDRQTLVVREGGSVYDDATITVKGDKIIISLNSHGDIVNQTDKSPPERRESEIEKAIGQKDEQ